jgi:hypothetical protein
MSLSTSGGSGRFGWLEDAALEGAVDRKLESEGFAKRVDAVEARLRQNHKS